MRILITGSREFRSLSAVRTAMLEVTAGQRGPHLLVHGNARGADQIAAVVAKRLGWQVESHPADWNGPCRESCAPGHRQTRRDRGSEYCPAAGHLRNQAMVDLGADVVVAFFKEGAANAGTHDCVRRARSAGLTVRDVTA